MLDLARFHHDVDAALAKHGQQDRSFQIKVEIWNHRHSPPEAEVSFSIWCEGTPRLFISSKPTPGIALAELDDQLALAYGTSRHTAFGLESLSEVILP